MRAHDEAVLVIRDNGLKTLDMINERHALPEPLATFDAFDAWWSGRAEGQAA